MSADLGKDATGAKPAGGTTGRTCDLRPSVSTDASSAAKVYVLLRADESCYGADNIVGVFSTLEAAQKASGETKQWHPGVTPNTWGAGWHGIEEHETAPVSEGRCRDGRRDVSAFPLRRNLPTFATSDRELTNKDCDPVENHPILGRVVVVLAQLATKATKFFCLCFVCGCLVHLEPPVLGTLT